jgi:hypothetical protein
VADWPVGVLGLAAASPPSGVGSTEVNEIDHDRSKSRHRPSWLSPIIIISVFRPPRPIPFPVHCSVGPGGPWPPNSPTPEPKPLSIPNPLCNRLLLLLLLLASFLLPPAAASTAGCWPKECGGLNITYPFWLEEHGQPPCGPPSFRLRCSSGGGAFLSIFPGNRSFHVVDHNLPLATGCPPPTVNVSLLSPAGTFAFSRANRELLFLGKCTGFPPPDSAGFRSLPCDKRSFVRVGDGRDLSIPHGCLFTVVPILRVPEGGEEDGYVASMENGFLVEWTAVPDDCPKCMVRLRRHEVRL